MSSGFHSVVFEIAPKYCISVSLLDQQGIAEKGRQVKGKEEKERHIQLNAEFQRIARRDKKAFLSEKCTKIEENNAMGKTRDVFKKVRDMEGPFHAKMGTIKARKEKKKKDRKGMDLI